MLAALTLLFALYLAAALLRKKRPREAERRATMCSFCLLVPALISHNLPLEIVSALSVYFAAYVCRAR